MEVCEWPVDYSGCETPEWDEEDAAKFESMAAELLTNWTGGRFGICEGVVRPCRTPCDTTRPPTFYGRGPITQGGVWQSVRIGRWEATPRCGYCSRSCCCSAPKLLRLPGPIVEIDEVKIGGEVLSPSAYMVDRENSMLVRIDGGGWPVYQDLTLPSTEPGTFEISYSLGREVPIGGQVAAGILAAELWKAACGAKGCQLPQRVQSITRQGVTMAVTIDSFDDVEKGRTGIWLIDSWVASVTKSAQRGSVRSPDLGVR